MEEYMKTLLEQIRCKKARGMIEKEIRGHIEEQIAANQAAGMTEEEAVQTAIMDMGDPVETGVSLDCVHKPQAAWGMILVMAAVSLITLLIHILIGIEAGEVANRTGSDYIVRTAVAVGAGFVLMLIVYHFDYSFLVGYAKIIAAAFLTFLFLQIFFLGYRVNGAAAWMRIPFTGGVSVIHVMLLYVPLYGALLYQYHGTGGRGILKSILWLLVPVGLAWQIPCHSLAMSLLFILSILLTLAVAKGWFLVDKKKFLTVYWSVLILMPILGIAFAWKTGFLAEYQIARITAFLGGGNSEYSYVQNQIRENLQSSHLFGSSGKEVIGSLPEYYSSYILTFLSSYYGIAAAIFLCVLLGFLAVKAIRISLHQKNQLGMMMGCGCGLVFLVNVMFNLCENFCLLPATWTFLPFLSYGGAGIVVSYLLMGIVLSVYRYKTILPAQPKQKKLYLKLHLDVKVR